MIISLDTECTGLDFVHGAMPFLVTTCADDNQVRYWEWDVDPLTRKPIVPDEDVRDITALIGAAEIIYLQNAKFDARALSTIGVDLPWSKVRDTLVMGHLLASNFKHDLTSMCREYLGDAVADYMDEVEVKVEKVVKSCRATVKLEYPNWRIAEEGLPDMPSVNASSDRDEDKPWKNDMWLPRALAKVRFQTAAPSNYDACAVYANSDSTHTLHLGMVMEQIIRDRGLWKIYEHRLHLPRVACEMECRGITAIGTHTQDTIFEYEMLGAEAEAAMADIAASYGHKLEMAAGASLNDNMRDFFYGAVWQECPRCNYSQRVKHWSNKQATNIFCPKCAKPKRGRPGVNRVLVTRRQDNLGLPIIASKTTGNATLDKDAMQEYITTLEDGPALDFIELLATKRGRDTALTYMRAYARFWVPIPRCPGYFTIHPSLNPCRTAHLRWGSNSPNMQNVSGETKGELSNKSCFGPAPGREWWSMDFKSIERRIPPYECGEPKMVEVFENPNRPPYWGNLYNLTASVLYPDEYWPLAEIEGEFRKQYPKLYKQAKFFDLAKQYGCGRKKGDLLSKIHNSFDKVDNEFPLLASLQARVLRDAERKGYIETLPDRSVDPEHGYPILVGKTDDGRLLTTTPFNYRTSGTACWVKNTALVRCADRCAEWRSGGFDAWLILEVHDELLFDFPRGKTWDANLWRAAELRELMEQGGRDLVPSIPTPVSVSYHDVSWAEGRKV